MEMVRIDQDRCTLCGLCISVCPRRILEERAGSVIITDQTRCNACGHCKAICPDDAPQLLSLNTGEFEPVPRKEDLPQAGKLMGFFRSRRSIRIFQNKSVEREKLESIIEAGRFAPTGGNRQPLQYVVLQTAKRIQTIRSMAINALADLAKKVESAGRKASQAGEPLAEGYRHFQGYVSRWREMAETQNSGKDRLFFHAPAITICHFDPAESATPEADPGLAAMQMTLMAEALGLGTCFCGFLVFAIRESPELRKVLHIPQDHSVPFSFMVGYPDVKYTRLVSRKPARVFWL